MKQRININLIPNGVAQVVHLSQNDYLNGELEFYLFHGSSVLSDGIANAMIKGLKPDNNIFLYNATSINGNVVTFNVTEQMTAVAGKVDCKLRIQTADGAKHSKAFILDCEADPTTDGNVSESVIDALEELIEQVTEDAAEAQAAAESANEDADRAEQAADDLSTFITRTGNPVVADKAEEKPLEKYVANIEPKQNLNGYDHPWTGGSGKNIADVTAFYGSAWTDNGDGSYTLSKNGTGLAQRCVTYDFTVSAGQTFTFSAEVVAQTITGTGISFSSVNDVNTPLVINGNRASATLTASAGSTNMRLYFNSGATGVESDYVTLKNIQIEVGGEETDYEPYSNICPISGYTEINIFRDGNNLIDGLQFASGYYDDSGAAKTSSITNRIEDFIPCEGGKKYAIEFVYADNAPAAGNRIRVHEYDANQNWLRQVYISAEAIPFDKEKHEITWTASSDASFFRFSMGFCETCNCAERDSYEIEFPSAAGTVYGGTLTVNDDGSGTLTVNRGLFNTTNLDGTESWYNPSANAFSIQCLPDFAVESTDDGNETITNETSVSRYNYNNMRSKYPCICTRNNSKLVYVAISADITTIEDAKAWLTAHPMQICYTLYTPVTYALSALQVVQMLEGTDVIWNDAKGDQEVTYWHNSALNTLSQDIVDMQEAIDDMGDTIDDLSAEVVRKEDITQSGTVTTAGQYAVDARQLNPTISGTIAKRVTDLEDGVVLKSALSRSTSVASTKTAAVDAYELNASKSGTIAAKVKANTDALNSFKFGFTQDGKAGYIDPTSGADTVTPFKNSGIEEIVTVTNIYTPTSSTATIATGVDLSEYQYIGVRAVTTTGQHGDCVLTFNIGNSISVTRQIGWYMENEMSDPRNEGGEWSMFIPVSSSETSATITLQALNKIGNYAVYAKSITLYGIL